MSTMNGIDCDIEQLCCPKIMRGKGVSFPDLISSWGVWCWAFGECVEDSSTGFDVRELSVEVDGHEALA